VAVATALLGWVAVVAGLERADASAWLIGLDVTVGGAFIAASLAAAGRWPMRALVAVVGAVWLLGSIIPAAAVAHQGALVLTLVAFPAGRPRAADGWVAVAVAVPVTLGLVPQPLVALLFAGVAIRSVLRRPLAWAYPAGAAGGVALALSLAWLARSVDPTGFDPAAAVVGYDLVLLLAAMGFPFAMRLVDDRSNLRQRLLRPDALRGLDGLGSILADALHDPAIQVCRWDAALKRFVDGEGEPVSPDRALRLITIRDGSAIVGAVAHRSRALDDERTASAVADALRPALVKLEGQHELAFQLAELEAARARLLVTVDRERAAVAARLRDAVISSVGEAAASLRELRAEPSNGEVANALTIALNELDGTNDELMQLVDGLGPAGLGDGGLVSALRALAARSPSEVEVDAGPDAVGDATAEAALYYVCLEAMSNAAKHSWARTLRIAIRRQAGFLEAVVSDDGVGGADPEGAGFGGLADRLGALGGRLRVESPPGAGTTVTGAVPISRSSATPST
jgi:signal transduction histidine kinase